MIAADMTRLFSIILVLLLGGCGAVPPAASPSEDTGRRLVGNSGGFSSVGSDGGAVDLNPSDDAVDVASDEPPVNPIRTEDPEVPDAGPDDVEDADDPLIDIPGGLPVDPTVPAPPDTVEPSDPSLFDLGFFDGMDPELFGEFLPFLTDSFLLDSLFPSGSSSSDSFADSFSYLELLCRDLDLPNTYCRGRYGN